MRTVVTGAAGFIGSTLVDRLLAEGHYVLGIDNFSTGLATNLDNALGCSGQFKLVQADIQAPELTDLVVGTNPYVIFHLAAQARRQVPDTDPGYDARCNVMGTINVCEAARRAGVKRVVYAASGASRYGAPTCLPVDENTPIDPLSPHAVAKLTGELYLRAYREMFGLAPICLALGNVYGPRQNPHDGAGVIAVFGHAMITGRPVTVFGDWTAARDYVYVDDVVAAFVHAARTPPTTVGTYNIGTGRQTTVADIYRLVSAFADSALVLRFGAPRPGEMHAIALDSTKAEDELGWTPSVDIADGIEKTMQWLRAILNAELDVAVGAA